MDGFTLIRHKADRNDYGYNAPAAIYWARVAGSIGRPPETTTFEIRTPLNAAGNGSEDPGEMYPPERSARSGLAPLEAIRDLYEETTPEALGLVVI